MSDVLDTMREYARYAELPSEKKAFEDVISEIEKLRARLEKAHSFISRADWMLFFEEEHAAAAALKETE